MENLKFEVVTSSNVDAAAYDENNLFVRFKNGTVYKYKSVPKQVYDNLLTAESVGKFMNESVKGIYEYEKV